MYSKTRSAAVTRQSTNLGSLSLLKLLQFFEADQRVLTRMILVKEQP